jgi:hypothetical protein
MLKNVAKGSKQEWSDNNNFFEWRQHLPGGYKPNGIVVKREQHSEQIGNRSASKPVRHMSKQERRLVERQALDEMHADAAAGEVESTNQSTLVEEYTSSFSPQRLCEVQPDKITLTTKDGSLDSNLIIERTIVDAKTSKKSKEVYTSI